MTKIKEVEGGEVSTPANATDGIELDTGLLSNWISVSNFATYVWNFLTSLTAKTTLVDADQIGIADSAASNVGKKITFANFKISIFSAPSISDFTNATHDHGDANDGGALVAGAITGLHGYSLQALGVTGFAPADSTTYYFNNSAQATTTAADRKLRIPITGTITKVYTTWRCTAGTSENSTVFIRLNDTTNTNVSTTLDLSTANAEANNTALSIAVTADDYITIGLTTPAWVTNPTNVTLTVVVWIQR